MKPGAVPSSAVVIGFPGAPADGVPHPLRRGRLPRVVSSLDRVRRARLEREALPAKIEEQVHELELEIMCLQTLAANFQDTISMIRKNGQHHPVPNVRAWLVKFFRNRDATSKSGPP
jgi:hypothetical protein